MAPTPSVPGEQEPYIWLLPTVQIAHEGDELILQLGCDVLRFGAHARPVLDILQRMDGSETPTSLRAQPFGGAVLDALRDEGWIATLRQPLASFVASHPEQTRQLAYLAHLCPELVDEQHRSLRQRRVMIVGLGGIGSHVAMALAGSGVGSFILNDPDHVEASNLNRQLFYTRADIGRPKPDALAAALHARFDRLDITLDHRNHDDHPDARVPDGVDLVVIGGELRAVRDRPDWLGRAAVLCGGYHGATGIVGPLLRPAEDPQAWLRLRGPDRAQVNAWAALNVPRVHAWNSSGATNNTWIGGALADAALHALVDSAPDVLYQRIQSFDLRTHQLSCEELPCPTATLPA